MNTKSALPFIHSLINIFSNIFIRKNNSRSSAHWGTQIWKKKKILRNLLKGCNPDYEGVHKITKECSDLQKIQEKKVMFEMNFREQWGMKMKKPKRGCVQRHSFEIRLCSRYLEFGKSYQICLPGVRCM